MSPAFVEQLRAGYAAVRASGHRGRVTAEHVRKMQAEQARHEAESAVQGRHHADGMMRVTQGSNQTAYLLRRLARLGGDWIERYEAGEFASVRQAAIAAGIVKVPSVLDQLRKLWAKATPADRRAFLREATP